MKVLILDCAFFPTVQIIVENKVVAEEVSGSERSCDNYMALIDKCLTTSNLMLDDIDVLAINKGPGSFTGLRVAASIAKGFGFDSNIEYKTFTSFDYIDADKKQVVVMPGFSNFVYVKDFDGKMDCVEFSLLDKRKSYVVCDEKLFATLTNQGFKVSLKNKLNIVDFVNTKLVSAKVNELEPLYLRKSQAEIQRENNLVKK